MEEGKQFWATVEEVIGLWWQKQELSETVCRIILVYLFKAKGENVTHGLHPRINSVIDQYTDQAWVEQNRVQ